MICKNESTCLEMVIDLLTDIVVWKDLFFAFKMPEKEINTCVDQVTNIISTAVKRFFSYKVLSLMSSHCEIKHMYLDLIFKVTRAL